MAEIIKGMGWHPSIPDYRDLHYEPDYSLSALAAKADLRSDMPAIWDQLDLGSCTTHATAALACYLMKRLGFPVIMPARLFLYYNTRIFEKSVDFDSGASLRNALKSLVTYGCPNENMWWYNIAKFTVKPNLSVYNDGLRRKIIQYAKVPQSISAFQACLTAGNPIVGGFTVFQSFMNTGSDGMVVMPEGDESVLGGHAICIVGFDAAKRVWIVRNSWGKNWGDNGYGYFPYEYLTSPGLAADFWTATSISNN